MKKEESWTMIEYLEQMENQDSPFVPYRWSFDDIKEWSDGTYLRTPESYERVIKTIIEKYKLNGRSRKRIQVDRRKFLFWVCIEKAKFTTIKTGKMFNRDHSTICYSLREYEYLKNSKSFKEGINELIELFKMGSNLKSEKWKR
jgi:hypothetical protein